MISIQGKDGAVDSGDVPIAYRVAGHLLICDESLAELEPFRALEPATKPPREPLRQPIGPGRTVYRGQGWVGGKYLQVECSSDAVGYRLAVERAAPVWISGDGRSIIRLPAPAPQDPVVEVQALLGPALCLALALRGTFCLHASAVDVGEAAIALVGPSGAGKSTLASRLEGLPDLGWRRAADDVLPVASTGGALVIRPHFPQLKLPASEQWGAEKPEAVPLAALYVLSLNRPDRPLEVERLTAREGGLAVIRHTVAGRLFSPELKGRHLDFSIDLAARLPVRRLILPRRPGLPDRLISTIQADSKRALGGSAELLTSSSRDDNR